MSLNMDHNDRSEQGLENYPHVLKNIYAMWGTLSLEKYFQQTLFVEDRPSRQGFPAPVFFELMFLYDIYTTWMEMFYDSEHDPETEDERSLILELQDKEDYASWQGFGTGKKLYKTTEE